MLDTSNESAELAVFGVEFIIKTMHFMDFEKCYPALNVTFEDQKSHTLFPFTDEADQGTVWRMRRKQRFTFSSNAFKTVKRSKMTIDLISPNDPYPLATIAYDLSPFLTDSIAARGFSPVANVKSVMKDLMKTKEVLEIEFDIRTIFFNNCLKRPAVTGEVGPLPWEESHLMRNDSLLIQKSLEPLAKTGYQQTANDDASRRKKLMRAQSTILKYGYF